MNLCAIYLLPLLGFNVQMFGIGNVLNVYITNKREIVVHVKKTKYILMNWSMSSYFIADIFSEHGVYLFYSLPEKYYNEYQLFLESKYSKFSPTAKRAILKNSGLPWMTKINGKVKCNSYLLGLMKHPKYKALLEERIGVKLPDDAELISCIDIDSELLKLPNISTTLNLINDERIAEQIPGNTGNESREFKSIGSTEKN